MLLFPLNCVGKTKNNKNPNPEKPKEINKKPKQKKNSTTKTTPKQLKTVIMENGAKYHLFSKGYV